MPEEPAWARREATVVLEFVLLLSLCLGLEVPAALIVRLVDEGGLVVAVELVGPCTLLISML